MYNNTSTDNSPAVVTESNTWSQSYIAPQQDESHWSNPYPNRFNFNYQQLPVNTDLSSTSTDAYNLTNQAYQQYYGQMYNYNSYLQPQQNYYNAFNQQQPTQQVVSQNSNDELLLIQQKVTEKLASQKYISKEIDSINQQDQINCVSGSIPSVGNNTSSVSSETESNSYESNKENDENSTKIDNKSPMTNNYPAYFTTQKIANNTSKLSYTVYQLELLNAIYCDMKYPNSVQKTLIAKLIGITRDQVKIWFQNRRRKDTLVSQGKIPLNVVAKSQSQKRRKSTDEFEQTDEYSPCSPEQQAYGSSKKPVVENQVIEGVLYQLKIHQNAPSRLSTKRTKLTHNESTVEESKKDTKSMQNSTKIHQTNQVANELKSNNPNRIIDLSNILNKETTNQMKTISQEPIVKVVEHQKSENVLSMPSSFVITSTSSSSSSSSASGTSSSEDEINYQNYMKPAKFQVLQPSFSIQDYVNTTYNTNASYPKFPKVHNQFQTQAPTVYNQSYPQTAYNTVNKMNAWSASMPNYPSYQQHYVEQSSSDYDSVNGAQVNYAPQIDQQSMIQKNQYLYNQTNEQAYQYIPNNNIPLNSNTYTYSS